MTCAWPEHFCGAARAPPARLPAHRARARARACRWGRGQETPGEDVFLGAAYAREWVPGLQEAPADPRYLQVSAACKHWAAYDLEAWNGSTRHDFNAVVSERDLLDSYAPAFQACVSDARSSGVM